MYMNEKSQPINMHRVNIGGDRSKKLLVKLTPTFTSGKLKNMYPTMLDCSKSLVQYFEEHTKSKTVVDVKDVASKYTTDVIGSCVFGIECHSFIDSRSEFHQSGKDLFTSTTRRFIRRTMTLSFPKICSFFGMLVIDHHLEALYTNTSRDTVKYREDNNINRNDFLQILLTLRNKEDPNKRIDMQDIINQSFMFYVASFETVMTFTLLELARNPEIQDKLRNEITQVLGRHKNEITYDAIHDLKYLLQVLDESLRMYPPVTILNRGCSKEYPIPGTDRVLEKGTMVFNLVYAIHHDEEFYPDPNQFDPERFSDKNRASRHPYTFLPFGEGPRMCIGMRFAYLQAKIGLVTLLLRFKFALHPNVEYPIKFNRGFSFLQSETNILLTLIAV